MASPLVQTLRRVILPLIIGIGVAVWLFHDDFTAKTWEAIHFGARAWIALGLGVLFMCGRDFGLTWRFHTIADGDLSWARALRVDIMCAFTSAITPSAVGGSALAIFYLNREGISLGRATTLTLTTLFLDELFFVVFCPVLVLLLPGEELFGGMSDTLFLSSVKVIFWIVYAGIVIWTAILFAGIIALPHRMRDLFHRLFSHRWLRRWQSKIDGMTDNMVETSAWVKGRGRRWWFNVFGATVVSWFSRYFVVNALFWGFVPAASGLVVFGRQFVVWVVLMVSPTPGGSGISEWLFTNYYGDLIANAGIAVFLALAWRLLSYYVYILGGICLLPSYFKKK